MPGPYDYSLGAVPDPSAALMQGVQAGAGVHALGLQQQAQEQALRQQQQQSAVIQSLISKPNATAQDYANASLVLPPAMREQVKQSWDMRNTDQQQSVLQDTGKVFAALGSGQPQVAAQLLRGRAALLKETDANQAKALDAMAGVVDAHPEFARTLIGMHLASLPGGDKVIQNLSGLGVEQRAQDKAPVELSTAVAGAQIKEAEAAVAQQKAQEDVRTAIWNNANVKSQIQDRAARLNLDRDKLTTETEIKLKELQQKFGQLPDSAVKIVNDSAVQATASAQSAAQTFDLAGRLEKAGGGYGGLASASEWMAKATGNQDALTGMRQEYTRMMVAGVTKLLPPGPASDKDIALAREGFPTSTADAKYLASFLRGMAKMQAYDSALNNAKAEWAGAVQHLGRTKTDIDIAGVKVPAGATFPDYAKKYLQQQADRLSREIDGQSRGYMRWATPGADW